MSDTPQGPGWWQASDDKWYPPPRPDMPGEQAPVQPEGQPAAPPAGPPVGPPTGPPTGPPMGGGPSPFGGMPAQPPAAPSNRTPLFAALAVLAVVAVVGLAFLLTSGDDGGDDTDTVSTTQPVEPGEPDVTTSEDTQPPTTQGGDGPAEPAGAGDCDIPEAEVGDGLVIVDCGFSSPAYPYEDGTFLPSWGFVLENQGDAVVEGAQFSVAMKAQSGSVIGFEEITVHVLPAGEELGVGFTAYNFDGSLEALGGVEVTYNGTTEVYNSPGSGSLTVSNEQTNVLDDSVETTFSVESSYSARVDDPATYVIYRNSDGDIIGGYGDTLQPDVITPDSSTAVYVENVAIYEDLDPEATDVYVEHGYSY